MPDVIIVQMRQRFQRYQEGERVSLTPETAKLWCGKVRATFHVADEVPLDEAARYFNEPSAPRQRRKIVERAETKEEVAEAETK